MKKNITIDIPEGYSTVKYNLETGHIEFINKNRPHSWVEYCANNTKNNKWYISSDSRILPCVDIDILYPEFNQNVCTSREEARAFLALMQLRQLRKAWIKDWEPNWLSDIPKYCIGYHRGDLKVLERLTVNRTLSFPSYEMAEEFLRDFIDLIKLAKPLL